MSVFIDAKIVATDVSYDSIEKQPIEMRGSLEYVMSRTDLCEFVRCPERYVNGYEGLGSDAIEHGSLIDVRAISPSKFETEYVIIPPTYPAPANHAKVKAGEIMEGDPLPWTGAANYCKDWLKKHEHKKTVKHADWEQANVAVANLKAKPFIRELLESSQTQVNIVATYVDPETELHVPFRGLIDLVPPIALCPALVDLKTCRNAQMRAWAKQVFDKNYHTQAALYLDLWNAATGETRERFVHIVQENYPPFHVEKPRELSNEYLECGRQSYLTALAFYCTCVKKQEWPGYWCRTEIDGFQMVEPEPWMITSDYTTLMRNIEMSDPREDPNWMKE